MELIKDYDCVINYHPGKANVVVDALSRKSVQMLRALNAHFSLSHDGEIVVELIAKPDLLNQVLEAQKNDEKISAIVNQSREGKETEFKVKGDGFLYYRDQVCVPNDDELKKSILEEAHSGSFSMHHNNTNIPSIFLQFSNKPIQHLLRKYAMSSNTLQYPAIIQSTF